ncbi:hypothetical protein AsAng_0038300 [Aureispira anguillae]|uniref:Uncharacterized protein n=1 Tax=Aureispira anguillae TaxID=2864201 RepID=A0A915YHG5_9BACT|nr:hypothetical protein AsAng_0038300 [Aureispira anguillae]
METCWKKGCFVGKRNESQNGSILGVYLVFQQNGYYSNKIDPFSN